MAQQAPSDILSSTEAAARLCVHPRRVAWLVRNGDLAALRMGSELCFRAGDVEDYRRRDAAAFEDYVVTLVAEAPPLSECQRARLAALLRQAGEGGKRAAC